MRGQPERDTGARDRRRLRRSEREGRLVGLDVVAVATGAELHARVEGFDGGAEIALDVHGAHGQTMELGIAALAVPEKGFLVRGPTLRLDDEAPRVGRAMGRVRGMGG